jgi:hypothetical protein
LEVFNCKKWEKKNIKNHFFVFGFQYKRWLNICISCLLYSYIWQNLPRDNTQFFYIFLCIITTLATNKDPLKKPLFNINMWNKYFFWRVESQKGDKQRTCDKVILNDQCKMCKNCQCYCQQVARSPPSIEPKPFNHHYLFHYHPSFATVVTIIVDFFVVTPCIS